MKLVKAMITAGNKVTHTKAADPVPMTVLKVIRGAVATCLLPESEWYYIYGRTLVDKQVCAVGNLVVVDSK